MRAAITLLIFASILAAPSSAQRTVTIGSRVRVAADTLGRDPRVLVVKALPHDSITLAPPESNAANAVTIPRIAIKRLEIQTGSHTNARLGMTIGLAVGWSVGAILGATSYAPCKSACDFEPRTLREATVWGAVGLAALTMPLGGIIGLGVETDHWAPVNARSFEARVTPAPGARGVGLAVSFAIR